MIERREAHTTLVEIIDHQTDIIVVIGIETEAEIMIETEAETMTEIEEETRTETEKEKMIRKSRGGMMMNIIRLIGEIIRKVEVMMKNEDKIKIFIH